MGHHQECGLEGNPLSLSWLSGEPKSLIAKDKDLPEAQRTSRTCDTSHPTCGFVPVGGQPSSSETGALHKDSDYESITLMRLRQAQERKRLIEQLAQQDDGID